MNKMKYTVIFLFFMEFLSSLGWAKPFTYYRVVAERNIFKSMWNTSSVSKTGITELEKTEREEEKRQAELKKEEEKKQLESKKRELESSFKLSGVVFNGKKLYALISDRQSGQGSTYVEGDMVREAKVISIDENTQTVVLDYEGKFKVTLRINDSR